MKLVNENLDCDIQTPLQTVLDLIKDHNYADPTTFLKSGELKRTAEHHDISIVYKIITAFEVKV